MTEPNDKLIESALIVSEFQEKLKALGVNYNTAVSVWMGENDQKIFTMHYSSDPIALQQSLQIAILPDGRARLLESKETKYPSDADLHPENARLIKRSGHVTYVDEGTYKLQNNFFSEITNIFKVDNT